ncbi:hypothetical protein QCA50_020167 [Cerrena zonata]|uniref:Uncharacterized protein n=1 Tax=Cerrena zonata TaxID=2478898 RepID=A0AAW0FHN7_9APHY
MGNGTLPELSLSMRPTVADFETALKMINDPAIKEEINTIYQHPPDIYTAVLSNATISGHDTAASLAEEFDTVTIGRRIYGECDTPCARTARVIHYIPDPNMSCVYSDMRNHVNYQRENISNEEMNVISKAKNHFHVLTAHENGAKVIIDQWVTPWTLFLKWILSVQNEEDYHVWRQYDLVLGLVDYSTEYIRSSTGITEEISATFDERMQCMADYTTIWPPINLIKMAACKWSTIIKLDDIAAKETHSMRPATTLWDGIHIPNGKVLKRCYSSYQEDVYLPDGSSRIPTVERLTAESVLPGRHWMVQDWVPHLRQLGELKVYFVDKKVVYIAVMRYSTAKSGWEFSVNPTIPTLAELYQNRSRNDFLIWPQSAEIADEEAGRVELIAYASKTLDALISREKRGAFGATSLAGMCRMDIGVIIRGSRCDYFVSEIERTIGLGIFGPDMVPLMAERLGRLWLDMLVSQ